MPLIQSLTLKDEYFQRRFFMSKSDIKKVQSDLLKKTYDTAFSKVNFYKRRFNKFGLERDSIKDICDIKKLPFTYPREIISQPEENITAHDRLSVSQKEICLIHTSAGTTGKPKIFAYTGRDVINWARNVATCFWINGFRKGDVVIGPNPFGEYTGGGGLYLGMIALGVTYIPMSVGPGVSEKVIAHITGNWRIGQESIKLDPILIPNGIVCLASFISRLEYAMEKLNIDISSSKLEKGAFGSEPWSDVLRERIEKKWNIDARDMYGLGEFFGPGVAAECKAKKGLHILSDAFIAEVINPKTDEEVKLGEEGELVLTGLTKEAMPLLRYRTGDKTTKLDEFCECSSYHKKIGRILGRIDKDDITLPGGISVNRLFIEKLILSEEGVDNEYVLTVSPAEDNPCRKLKILLEGAIDKSSIIINSLKNKIYIEYNHRPIVNVVPRGKLPIGTGKAKRLLNPDEFEKIEQGLSSYLKDYG